MGFFNKEFKIGNKWVGEIGANFDGSIEKAKKLIDAAKAAGADCAKFQTFTVPTIVSEGGFSKMELHGVHGSWGRSVYDVFKDVEFCSDAFPLAPNIRIDVSTQIRCSFNGTMNCVTYISHSLMFLDDIDSVNIVHSMARPWLINTNYMEISADFIAQKWEHNDTLGWDTIHYSGHATAKIPKSKFSSYN